MRVLFSLLFKNRIVAGIAIGIGALLVAGGGFYAGYERGVHTPQTVLVEGVSNIHQGEERGTDFSLFWDAWKLLKEKYVGADTLSNQNLLYGAVSGLFAATKDPYTAFMPPVEARKFGEDISGEFSGIGAEIGIRNDQLVIISPLKGSPAERIGLKANDKILKIDDLGTNGMNTDEAVTHIRGKKGTTVTLSILRNGWDKPRDYPVTREIIQVPTLDLKFINAQGKEEADGPIAYIHLYNFYEKAPFQFYQAIARIATSHAQGLVLDLRDNPGGYLEASITIAGWFVKPGEIVVREAFNGGQKQEYKADGTGFFKNFPMVALINEGSASASEILSGALRDDRGVTLVGAKSFGKGTVQEVDTLKDNSIAKITIAHWLTPRGDLIDKNGITPDVAVPLSEADLREGRDPQLAKAIEVLQKALSR